MASQFFSAWKDMPGKAFRAGLLGRFIAHFRVQMDGVLSTLEHEFMLSMNKLSSGAYDAPVIATASGDITPSAQESFLYLNLSSADDTTSVNVVVPFNFRVVGPMTVIPTAATLDNGTNTVTLKDSDNNTLQSVSVQNKTSGTVLSAVLDGTNWTSELEGGNELKPLKIVRAKADDNDSNAVFIKIPIIKIGNE